MHNIKIIENLLPDFEYGELSKMFNSPLFPWYWSGSTNDINYKRPDNIKNDKFALDTAQFVHAFAAGGKINSSAYIVVEPILKAAGIYDKIIISDTFRCKTNCLISNPNYPDNFYHPPHTDVSIDDPSLMQFPLSTYKTLLYYFNDSDGDTVFFNETLVDDTILTISQKVKPKKNMGVIFDSGIYHASTPPKNTDRRIIVNFVFNVNGDL